MSIHDLTIHRNRLAQTVRRAREQNIVIPTFKQMKNPELVSDTTMEHLNKIGMWEIHPFNLFRINWKNEPVPKGGLFGSVNYTELPKEITGVEARIVALIGKWFPTGSHKVGATFGCIVPRLVTGQFDPTLQKAVWPSTGNFCRGGAYISALLGCDSIAVLPEGMSRERFDLLKATAGEVITTPGGESNVREVFEKCRELLKTRNDLVAFNQFDDFGNALWHYEVTGSAMAEVLGEVMSEHDRYIGVILSVGSAGTVACGDFLKKKYPDSKIAVAEPLQCPTLLFNGFGDHRIEGIGDRLVSWIHNVRNTDMVIAVDDAACVNLIRLFNEPVGQEFLVSQGFSDKNMNVLPLMGISGVSNLLAAIKFAKYYELSGRDIVLTVFTDSMELYGSRFEELREMHGEYTEKDAVKDYNRYLMALATDNMRELNYYDRKRIHNLKYFNWVEQRQHNETELNAQWYDFPDFWESVYAKSGEIDHLIESFNEETGVRKYT